MPITAGNAKPDLFVLAISPQPISQSYDMTKNVA
jgi:hypothetical protein